GCRVEIAGPTGCRLRAEVRSRCPTSAQPGGEAGGIEWTTADESERCNRLPLKLLGSEVQRHQPFAETRSSEFESLPPSHNSLNQNNLRLRLSASPQCLHVQARGAARRGSISSAKAS